MIQFGNDNIKEIYHGSEKIKEVYHGGELVWQGIEGYWVHKDTGVKTSFDLEDSSITGGIMRSPSWKSDCSEVQLPSGVTGLAEYCFSWCGALTSVTLPKSVISLGRECFIGCSSLTSVTLPEGVTSLGADCFAFCSSLTLATVLPAIPPSLAGDVFVFTHANLIIKVPAQSVDAYKTATNWISYTNKISAI